MSVMNDLKKYALNQECINKFKFVGEICDILDFDDDNGDCIECDLNCVTVGWSLQKLVNDDTQPLDKRYDACIIRSWILSNSFNINDIFVASDWVTFFVLEALQTYKPNVDNESIDFVARYENVVSYLNNILDI